MDLDLKLQGGARKIRTQTGELDRARKTTCPTKNALHIFQGEFGICRSPIPIQTGGFNSCIVVTFYDKRCGVGALAHFDVATDVQGSFEQVIIPALREQCFDLRKGEVRIIGGQFDSSNNLRRAIRDEAKKPGRRMKIIEIDIIGESKFGLLLNSSSGEVFELSRSPHTDEIDIDRCEKAVCCLTESNRLIRIVNQ